MTAIEIKSLRKEVKKYVDHADERMLKAVRAMLGADLEDDTESDEDEWTWPHGMSEAAKADVLEGLEQLDRGEGIPHEEAIKMLKVWPGK